VLVSEQPNRIFRKVLEDNRRFGFENDAYSAEFFDFVLGVQKSVATIGGDEPSVQALRRSALEIGSKSTLEILAKALNNSCIDEHMQVLTQVIHRDPSGSLAREFLESWYHRDGFDYLFSLLLECTDSRARHSAAGLLKYVLVTLKMQE
jgi:hypothetical protein